jgi:hypothetical protein
MVGYLGSDKMDEIQTRVLAAQLAPYPTLLWRE